MRELADAVAANVREILYVAMLAAAGAGGNNAYQVMNGRALIIEGLRKHLGGVEVLPGLDTVLPEGVITAIIAPNGAGKTTLFNTITGELKPDALLP